MVYFLRWLPAGPQSTGVMARVLGAATITAEDGKVIGCAGKEVVDCVPILMKFIVEYRGPV